MGPLMATSSLQERIRQVLYNEQQQNVDELYDPSSTDISVTDVEELSDTEEISDEEQPTASGATTEEVEQYESDFIAACVRRAHNHPMILRSGEAIRFNPNLKGRYFPPVCQLPLNCK